MSFSLSTPDELEDEPELAPLEILRVAAEVSRRTLLAAHPELLSRDFIAEEAEISPRQCIAANILATLETLAEAVTHYQSHLDHLAGRQPIRRVDDNEIDF